MRYAEQIRSEVERLGDLPLPSDDAIAHSEQLNGYIQDQIKSGPISFHDFMQSVLYAPSLGYYSAGSYKIGPQGDFITAPEISSLFGHSLAQQCLQVLPIVGGGILEFGAGTGKLACDLMTALGHADCLPEHYWILELSPDLRQRQQQRVQQTHPDLFDRFIWLEQFPEHFTGVVLANEVLDAMPVECFQVTETGIAQRVIDRDAAQGLVAQLNDKPASQLTDWWSSKGQHLSLPEGYQSEVNFNYRPWLQRLSESVEAGLILLIDYGFPEHEYYHPQRMDGTLMCHYRHRNHTDTLSLLGLQDITAHVDFTAVAQGAVDSGLDVLGYTHQSAFLTSCGILTLAEQQLQGDLKTQVLLSQEIKPLIMPEEMGELFKVMALGKGLDTVAMQGLLGFRLLDLRQQL